MANYDMTLPEIFVKLPEDIQVALEVELERSTVPGEVTPHSVYNTTELVIEHLKNVQFPSASSDVRDLLDRVPQAVVDMLF
jgi:hypothetical protein